MNVSGAIFLPDDTGLVILYNQYHVLSWGNRESRHRQLWYWQLTAVLWVIFTMHIGNFYHQKPILCSQKRNYHRILSTRDERCKITSWFMRCGCQAKPEGLIAISAATKLVTCVTPQPRLDFFLSCFIKVNEFVGSLLRQWSRRYCC